MPNEELPLYTLWEQVLGDLLDRTMKFPRSVRFTLAGRMDNLALDILERIVEARYSSGPRKAEVLREADLTLARLREADLTLARLRALVRLSHARRHLDHRVYEHVSRGLEGAGRMLGGWRRQQGGSPVA